MTCEAENEKLFAIEYTINLLAQLSDARFHID